MSLKKVAELEAWLKDVLNVPSETFDVSLEQGKAQGFFEDTQLFRGCSELTAQDASAGFELCDAGLQQNAGMRDSYTLVVVIRNYAEEPVRIKLGLLRWLFENGQKQELDYHPVKNNQKTYDWFFYLNIEERTRNVGADLRTC